MVKDELKLDIKTLEYDEILGNKCLKENDWSSKITDGFGEVIGEQFDEEVK